MAKLGSKLNLKITITDVDTGVKADAKWIVDTGATLKDNGLVGVVARVMQDMFSKMDEDPEPIKPKKRKR